jgi:hypothetical protein
VARELNEAELRAVCTLLYETCVYTRTLFGKWRAAKHRPTQEELLQLGMRIKSAENQLMRLATVPPTSGHDMDIFIERLERDIAKNSQEQKEIYSND